MSTKLQTNAVSRSTACLTIGSLWALGAIVYVRSRGDGQAFFREMTPERLGLVAVWTTVSCILLWIGLVLAIRGLAARAATTRP